MIDRNQDRRSPDLRSFINAYIQVRPICHVLWRGAEFQAIRRLTIRRPLFDLGCGDGSFSLLLFGKDIAAGVDLNRSEIVEARRLGLYGQVMARDARNLPFASNRFRMVFSNCVMEHVGPLTEVLREVRRVLAPDGRFVFTVPGDRFNDLLFYPRMLRFFGLHGLANRYIRLLNGGLRHRQVGGRDYWAAQLRRVDLRIVEAVPIMNPTAMSVFDVMLWVGVPAKVWLRLFGRWTLLPRGLHARIMTPWIDRLLKNDLNRCRSGGGGLMLVAVKDRTRKD